MNEKSKVVMDVIENEHLDTLPSTYVFVVILILDQHVAGVCPMTC